MSTPFGMTSIGLERSSGLERAQSASQWLMATNRRSSPLPVSLLPVPDCAAEIPLLAGAQLGTGAARLPVALTAGRVVAAAGKRPHVAQCPDDRAVELLQCRDGEEAGADPVEMNDVRGELAHQSVKAAGQPAHGPERLLGLMIEMQWKAVEFHAQPRAEGRDLARQRGNRRIVTQLSTHHERGFDTPRLERLREPGRSSCGAVVCVIGTEMKDPRRTLPVGIAPRFRRRGGIAHDHFPWRFLNGFWSQVIACADWEGRRFFDCQFTVVPLEGHKNEIVQMAGHLTLASHAAPVQGIATFAT